MRHSPLHRIDTIAMGGPLAICVAGQASWEVTEPRASPSESRMQCPPRYAVCSMVYVVLLEVKGQPLLVFTFDASSNDITLVAIIYNGYLDPSTCHLTSIVVRHMRSRCRQHAVELIARAEFTWVVLRDLGTIISRSSSPLSFIDIYRRATHHAGQTGQVHCISGRPLSILFEQDAAFCMALVRVYRRLDAIRSET